MPSHCVVQPRSTVQTTWQVTAPSSASPGRYPLKATASYHGAASGTATGTANVDVPCSSLAAAYTNTGITDDSAPAAGASASSGKTYSAQALAAAGLKGGPVSYGGTSFSWPSTTGQPDNVEANGQLVAVSGSGSALSFLGASTTRPAANTPTPAASTSRLFRCGPARRSPRWGFR